MFWVSLVPFVMISVGASKDLTITGLSKILTVIVYKIIFVFDPIVDDLLVLFQYAILACLGLFVLIHRE